MTTYNLSRITEDKTQFSKKLERILHDPNRLYDGRDEEYRDKLPVLKAVTPK